MEKQIIYKNWEFTFNVCHLLGISGGVALPFGFNWWASTDAKKNKNWDFSLYFLCFALHVEIWKWAKGE